MQVVNKFFEQNRNFLDDLTFFSSSLNAGKSL